MGKQHPKLKKWQIGAAGGVLVGLAAIIGIGAATEQTAATATQPEPTPVASEPAAQEPTATTTTEAGSEQILTVENNAELAALLASREPSTAEVEAFATKYEGRTIQFDGNIATMSNHGDYVSRYDILIYAGDYSETSAVGPNFQFRDVSIVYDLHLTGSNIPDTLGAGQNLRITAQVGEYNTVQGLFLLDPITTEVR